MLSLALTLSLALPAARDDVVAFDIVRGDDVTPISLTTYRDWLIRLRGEQMASRYAQLLTVRVMSRELGLAIDEAAIATALEEEIAGRIESAFAGDEEGWKRELDAVQRTAAGYHMQRSAELEEELLLNALARSAREIDEEAERVEWERLFGSGGRSYDVRAISLKFSQPSTPPGTPAEELRALRDKARQKLLVRAEAIQRELDGGADFDALLAKHSDDTLTSTNGGRFGGGFPPPGWPQESLDAMAALEPGAVLDPVFVRGSYHVVRIDAVRTTPFEEGRARARTSLLERSVDAAEMARARGRAASVTELVVHPAISASSGPDDEVLMTVNGTDITRAEFGGWLVRLIGERDVPFFAQMHTVTADAAEQGFAPTTDEVRQRLQFDIDYQIEKAFFGIYERWLESIQPRYADEEAFVRQMMPLTEHHLMAEAMLAAERVVTDDDVRGVWQERYGENGRRLEVRWIRFDIPRPRGTTPEQYEASTAEVLATATKIRRRIAGGEDFATLARQHSTDRATRDQGGLPNGVWDSGEWRDDVQAAVAALGAGDLSQPIVDGTHIYLFEVLSDRRVELEDVADEIRTELLTRRPSDPERAAWLNVRSQTYTVQKRAGLYQ